jgi:DNA (cytosine-5)-methyltransferase 1
MNYLDLFSGIGGFALGAYWAGWRFDEHYFSEVDDYAIQFYQRRFPDAINLGDIREIVANTKSKQREWIVTGGFPCQDISCAGKGAGLEGGRSGLWFAMRDVIGLLRPRYCIIENVGAITSRGLDVVLGNLAEIGYDAEWQDIRASDVGAPHRRERIWIVAYPNNATTARQREDSGKIHTKSKSERFNICSGARLRKREQGNGRFCNWSVEPDVGRVAHGIPKRVDRLKGLGNSIVPQIAELLFRKIAEVESCTKPDGMLSP